MIGIEEDRLRAMARVEEGDEEEAASSAVSRATEEAPRGTVHLAAIANSGDVRRAPVFTVTLCGLDAARAVEVVLDLSAPSACAGCLSERDRGAESFPPRYGACSLQPVMVAS